MPVPTKPKLVNRGPAGLLTKSAKPAEVQAKKPAPPSNNKIAEGLAPLVVDISTLIPDPDNARLHPERNMESIKASLNTYGQTKPIVVREQNSTVMAGNGTMAAAKELGWTKIAAVFIPMTDAEAAGYGVADNRTAELAKWDFEVLGRLEKLVTEAGHDYVGWSAEEIAVLRAADGLWTPPPAEEGGDTDAEQVLTLKFTPAQKRLVLAAAALMKERTKDKLDIAGAVALVCEGYK